MVTAIEADLRKLNPGAKVELFTLDTTPIGGGTVDYFHSGTTLGRTSVQFQGKTYNPWPIEAEGYEKNGSGGLPKPRVRVANRGAVMTATARQMGDLVGAALIRRQTYVKYLDGQPTADPTKEFPPDIFYVGRKTVDKRDFLEFELVSSFELRNVTLPGRIMVQTCNWLYRGPECGYTGPYYDRNDQPTGSLSEDTCPKLLSSCKVRQGSGNELTFGGFPGLRRYV